MKLYLLVLAFFITVNFAFAQYKPNTDESKVPEYKLPNVLKTFNGKKIKNSKQWEKKRRPELLNFFTQNVYGEIPGDLTVASCEIVEKSDNALKGKAKRKQVVLSFKRNGKTLNFTILIYTPKNTESSPVFLSYDFSGNHTITDDVNIIISDAWASDNPSIGIINNQLTEQSRGADSDSWPIEKIIDAGFGLAVIFYCEIDPDKDDFSDGVHPFFYVDDQQQPADNEWGSLAAWAWGLSKAEDYFEQDKNIDASKVIVLGHSRLGKAALWAGASDKRFAGVISNESGCGGAALSKRRFGETIWRINRSFPYWFAKNFRNYDKREETLPVDQHELIALIAPRPVYISSAAEDLWSDPKGEFLSAYYASAVYKLYGEDGISQKDMPEINHPIQNTVAYHIRSGKHNLTVYDWEQYIKWAKTFIK
jgi:hypothetical protein